jgi:predicted acyltransferase
MVATARLRSLDVLRGFDMFWIIGGDGLVHALSALTGWGVAAWASGQLGHAEWNGFTFYDLIFPLFIFIAGVSFPYASERRLEGSGRSAVVRHVVIRAAILIGLGVVYNNGLFRVPWGEMRYPSVLGRIGLAYLVGALLTLYLSRRRLYLLIPAILVAYWGLLLFFPWPGLGPERLTVDSNLVGAIDQALVPGNLYLGVHDPEGLLSTLPAAVNFIIGVAAADLIRGRWKPRTRAPLPAVGVLAGLGAALVAVGAVWGIWFPVNKNLWTSSFVAVTAGLSLVLLAGFHLIVDMVGLGRAGVLIRPFEVIGRNSILIYLAPLAVNFEYLTDFFVAGLVNRISDPEVLTLTWLSAFVSIKVALLWFLDRKRLYFKV